MITSSEELKELIISSLEEKKAADITVINLGDKNPLAKYLIIATGRSTKNVSAIADSVSMEVKRNTSINVGLEGAGKGEWVLIDTGDIVVHIFHPEARARFNLEELWGKK